MVQLLLTKLKIVSCYLCWVVAITFIMLIENKRPTMKELNRYVTWKHAIDWYDIGIELGLELEVLDIIKKDNPQQSATCFQKTLNMWLQLNSDNATWKTLEVALTNVNRAKLQMDPVEDVLHGKDVAVVRVTVLIQACLTQSK